MPDHTMLQNRSASTVVLLLVLAAVNLALVGLWSITSDDIARESGPIENLQLVALAAAIIVFAHSGNISGNVFRPFLFFLCIGCVYLLFREVDFRTMPVWDWVRLLSSSVMRKGIQGIILLVLAGYLWRNLAAFRNAVSRLRPGDVWPYVCVFVLFMLAKGAEEISRADKNPIGDFALPHGQFWEEMLELNADMMLLIAALLSYGLRMGHMERAPTVS